MTMHTLEKAIWRECQQVTGRKQLRLKDIVEWSTDEGQVRKNLQENEEYVYCPDLKIHCAIPKK